MVNPTVAAYQKWFHGKLCDKENCPADSTLKTYAYSMGWLHTRIDGFSVDGLTSEVPETDTVLKYMQDNDVKNTRRLASYTALKVHHNCKGEEDCSKKYCTPLIMCKRKQDSDYAKQERSPHQSKNWVEFKVLKKFAACLREKVTKFNKNELWTKDQYATATLAFILNYHLTYPIRRCLCTVKWGVEPSESYNYLDAKKQEIVFNQHKTARWKGAITHKLSRPMWRLFSLLRKQQKMRDMHSGMVLINRYWRPMTKNGYSSWLKREMKGCKGCEDKQVGCLILRHAVITHKRRKCMTTHQRENFATQCMHSSGTNDTYRVH